MLANRLSLSQRAALAQAVRERFVAQAGRVMVELVNRVQSHLTEVMDAPGTIKEKQARRDAWTFYQRARAPWLDATMKVWQNSLKPQPAKKTELSLDDTQGGGLELVGTEVMDDKIMASRLVISVMEKVSSELDDLKLRIRFLEDTDDLDGHDILRPEVLVLLMLEQWATAGMPRESWSLVNEVVAKSLPLSLKAAYAEGNAYLIKQGVMPTIDLKDRVKRPAGMGGRPPPPRPLPQQTPDEAQAGGDWGQGGAYYDPGSYAGSPGAGVAGGFAPAGVAGQPGAGVGPAGQPGPGYGGAAPGPMAAYGPGGAAGGFGSAGGAHAPAGGHAQGGGYGHGAQPQGASAPAAGFAGGRSAVSAGTHPGAHPGAYAGAAPGAGVARDVGGGGSGAGHSGAFAPHSGANPPHSGVGSGHSAHPPSYGASSAYGSAGMDETRMMTQATPLARARTRAQGVIGQLKRMFAGAVGSDFEATAPHAPSPELAAAIAPGVYQASGTGGAALHGTTMDYSPAGVARVAGALREQTTELKKKTDSKNEKATIEIVALMFQAILTEERIPPAIRVWFARLQMPVLRVALAEPEFFGTLTHPARQLIDRMGSVVMGFDAAGIEGSAIESEIKRIVQVIEQYPETGKRVFQLVYDEFVKFLGKFLTEKGSNQKVVSVAQQVEQKETLAIQYTIEMRNLLKDMPVREEIRTFLFKVWAEVLAVAAVRKGVKHADTLALKKSVTDLLWAASAKPNRADRAKVIQDLPRLLQSLRAGMGLLGLPPTIQDAHIKTVSDTLADAFLSKTQAIDQAQIEALTQRLSNLEDVIGDDAMGDLPLDAESIEMMLGIDASAIVVVTDGGSKPTPAMVAWAKELHLGDWFTLDHNGRVTRVQFVWRSDRKHLNLFASADGHSVLIQAGRLAAYLQAGLLLPQEEETLTVRATRDAIKKIEANPERLLS